MKSAKNFRVILIWFAAGIIIIFIWYFLPQIILKFLPPGSSVTTTSGEKIGA